MSNNNPIDILKEQCSTNISEELERDAWLYRLRGNIVLNWVEKLKDINKYKRILKECSISSTLETESGIVKINPIGYYISHEFVPHFKAGFSFYDLSVIMKYEIIKFEDRYGEVGTSDKDIEDLTQLMYFYNRTRGAKLDMNDKKKLIHLEQSAEVLYYILSPSVFLKSQVNGWCSLTFSVNNSSTKDYCTIFNEEQINLLERVNKAINLK